MGKGFTGEMIQKATEFVRKKNSATASGIMRELKIGYTDAKTVLNELERLGVVKRSSSNSAECFVINASASASTKVGPFDIYMADNGWCVWEGNQLIKAGVPTLEGAVNLAEYLIGKERKAENG